MKKLLVAAAALSAAAIFAGGVAANPNAGKVVASGFSCGLLDGNGNFIVTDNSTLTLYQTKAVLRCEGNGAGAANGPIYFNYGNTGLGCGMLDFGITLDWSDKVGYNGNSQLTCTTTNINSASSGGAGLG